MLYSGYEMFRSALTPMTMAAAMMNQMTDQGLARAPVAVPPLFGIDPMGMARATNEMFIKLSRQYSRPGYGISEIMIEGKKVSVTEDVVEALPFARLVRFHRELPPEQARKDPPVLLVVPMSGHFPTLMRDTIEGLLPEHDVYVTDWENARDVALTDGAFDLNTYIDYVMKFLEVCGAGTHVVTVSQPGCAVLAATAILSKRKAPTVPASVTLMACPVDTRVNPTVPGQIGMKLEDSVLNSFFVQNVPFGYAGVGRRVYPGFLQLAGFVMLNAERHVAAHFQHFWDIVADAEEQIRLHDEFYSEYMAVMDMPAEFFLQSVAVVFRDHLLVEGAFTHDGDPVDLHDITDTAIMTVEAGKDDISGRGQTDAAHDLCPHVPESRRMRHFQPEVGHMGVFHGTAWREEICPKVAAFIRNSDDASR